MRPIDLPKIPQEIQNRLDAHSEEKAREFSNSVIQSTSGGRGLWLFLLLPACFMAFAAVMFAVRVFIELPMPVAIIGGLIGASIWWNLEFTRRHPFWSSVLANLAWPVLYVIAAK